MLSSFFPQKNIKNNIINEINDSNIHYDESNERGDKSTFSDSNKDKTNSNDDKNKSPLRQFHFPVVPNSPAPLDSKVTMHFISRSFIFPAVMSLLDWVCVFLRETIQTVDFVTHML
jgi:hypothetical protein